MTVTGDSRFHSAPTISVTQFHRVLEHAGSPWASASTIFYNVIRSLGDDPGKWLGVCKREHRFLTDTNAVALKLNTNSWTNARTIRLTELDHDVITTADLRAAGITNRNGPYIRYRSVVDSLRDGIWRIRDPEYVYHRRYGDGITIEQVLGLWTEDDAETYIAVVVDSLNEWIAEDEGTPMVAQIPGFVWQPADDRHHTKGRTQAISGFAVHYTGGTNSLGWLTTSPNSDVSATFLIKHNPTLEDRGWQLVRIEDTPHTTGSPVNSFTCSFEYEQLEDQEISDMAYEVMAQTILDTAVYVTANGLGSIPITRQAIRGHKEWVGDNRVCPDGIEVDRIVEIAQGGVVSGERTFAEVPFSIRGRIRSRWEDAERAGLAYVNIGYPLSPEYPITTDDGRLVVWQDFERLILEYDGTQTHPWDVTAVPLERLEALMIDDQLANIQALVVDVRSHIEAAGDALVAIENRVAAD